MGCVATKRLKRGRHRCPLRKIRNHAHVANRICRDMNFCYWPVSDCHDWPKSTLNGHSSTSAQGRKLLAPLLQRNIHICLPLILRCLGIGAQVIEEQRLVTKFLSTGRKPIAVNRIDRFADVIR